MRATLFLTLSLFASPAAYPAAVEAPKTRTDNVVENFHGVEVIDPYRWLEDQDSAETRAWIQAQNEYTRAILDPAPARAKIAARLNELMRIETQGLPLARAGRYFYMKRQPKQNQAVFMMREGLKGAEKVVVDPNPLSPDQSTSVVPLHVTRDGKWVFYGLRAGGEDEFTLHIRDADTGRDLPDRLPRGRYSVSATPNKKGFYYHNRLKEGSRIFYHEMGTDPSEDREVFGAGRPPEQYLGVSVSHNGNYLILSVSHGSASAKVEIFYQDLRKKGPITALVDDIDAMFSPSVGGNTMFVHTNWNAPNGKILAVDLNNPRRENWKEIIPESEAIVTGMSLTGGRIAVNYLENVQSKIRIFDTAGKHIRDIAFPSIGNVSSLSGQWESDEAFYSFTSFGQPSTGYRYSVSKATSDVWFRPKVNIDPARFEVKQVWYHSKDGTRVPMFLFHKKGLTLDGNRPVLLTGYGGFNLNRTPGFSAQAVILAENDGVFALANLRGGGEFGNKWHRAAMFENKQNSFDDFIAAAEWLVANKYTKPARLAIQGGSNGGLLVGAAMTQRPELFQAVVCQVPLLDMLRYQHFLLARLWTSEYGSAENPEQFKYISKYSPYHHVKEGVEYPAVLFVTGDSDTRVAPLHARKMAARMQAATASERPILLLYDTKAGHSTGLPVSKQIEDSTDLISFLFQQLSVGSR